MDHNLNGNGNDNNHYPPAAPLPEEHTARPFTPARPKRKLWKMGLFLLVAGLIVISAGYASGGFGGSITFGSDGFKINTPSENREARFIVNEHNLEPFETINVDTSSAEITLVESDHYGLEIDVPESFKMEWEVSNGQLTVLPNEGFSINIMNFSFSDSYVKVYYPSDASFESVKLHASSGDITADIYSAREADLHASSGDIEAAILNRCEFIKINSSSGSVYLSGNGQDAVAADIHASSGDITVENGAWTDLVIDASSGTIRVMDAELMGQTDIYASSGEVEVFGDAEDDYGYDISASSGSIYINGDEYDDDDDIRYNTGAENMIKIHTSSGDISLDME